MVSTWCQPLKMVDKWFWTVNRGLQRSLSQERMMTVLTNTIIINHHKSLLLSAMVEGVDVVSVAYSGETNLTHPPDYMQTA